jgi:hypothetical protein
MPACKLLFAGSLNFSDCRESVHPSTLISDSTLPAGDHQNGQIKPRVALAKFFRRLAFIDDLNIVAVRIKHPGRIVARIVFETGLR